MRPASLGAGGDAQGAASCPAGAVVAPPRQTARICPLPTFACLYAKAEPATPAPTTIRSHNCNIQGPARRGEAAARTLQGCVVQGQAETLPSFHPPARRILPVGRCHDAPSWGSAAALQLAACCPLMRPQQTANCSTRTQIQHTVRAHRTRRCGSLSWPARGRAKHVGALTGSWPRRIAPCVAKVFACPIMTLAPSAAATPSCRRLLITAGPCQCVSSAPGGVTTNTLCHGTSYQRAAPHPGVVGVTMDVGAAGMAVFQPQATQGHV